MDYTVDIIDTIDNTHVISLENASTKSILLHYNGGDKKDELFIVGSSLDFTLVHNEIVDAKYGDLFTGDENRYKVRLYKSLDNKTIWSGFLLPDAYQEPYTNSVTVSKFQAVDGLGRLRGKYLSTDFYTHEKSVIDIISNCLALTDLQLDIWFLPAIENYATKDYKTIYINTNYFVDNNKQLDAYTILHTLMHDMVCTCYQASDRWYIQGLNQRHVLQNEFKIYSYQGIYISTVTQSNLIKAVSAFVTPLITMVAPYNKITVTRQLNQKTLPSTVFKETNDNWAITTGVVGEIYPTDWNGNNFFPMAIAPDYNLIFKSSHTGVFDSSKYINLKKKIYVDRGDKFNFSIKLSNKSADSIASTSIHNWILNGDWSDIITIDIVVNNNSITTKSLNFNASFVAEDEFDILIETPGLLDIKIYQNVTPANLYISNICLDEIKLNAIDFNDVESIDDVINENFTIDKNIEITYADDASAFSKSFQLAKLNDQTQIFNTISIPVLYGFSQNNINYSVVSLAGCNLITENSDKVYYNSTLLTNISTEYNYANGEQMVVITPTPITTGSFDVRVYKYDDFVSDRTTWTQWSDSIYGIEKVNYITAVKNIYRRLFKVQHHKIDMTVKGALKFNDLIRFRYISPGNYILTNTVWDLDAGESSVSMVKAIYQSDNAQVPGDHLPPVVIALDDFELTAAQNTANLTAQVSAPDGVITSFLWTKLIGANGTITTPTSLNTALTNVTDDDYTYQITVTDSNGLIASDVVNITRILTYIISLTTITETITTGDGTGVYRIALNPNIPANYSVKLSGTYDLITNKYNQYNTAEAYFKIKKNGVYILNQQGDGDIPIQNGTFEFNIISTDIIDFEIYAVAIVDDPQSSQDPYAKVLFDLIDYVFNAGNGIITGLPINKTIEIIVV